MIPFSILDTTSSGSAVFAALVLATFVSEDLTCLAAGLLVAAGRVDWLPALSACFIGIAVGDFGVWLLGRTLGRRAAQIRWVRKRLPEARLAVLSNWLERNGGATAFVSRFLPGTRVPLLLAAGIARTGGTRYLLWAVVAALVWVPVAVGSAAVLGAAAPGWAVACVACAAVIALRIASYLFTRVGRAKLSARVAKLWRWEFWPARVFYLPLVPYWLWLGVKHRGFTVWTAANPAIPAGGVVGESKSDILARLPDEWIIPSLLLPPGAHAQRTRAIRDALVARGWHFPLILKPDAGERGAGVKKACDFTDAEKYLLANPGAVLVQPFHPGPCEAGVFYYRLPGAARGRVFSITDKVFPVVVGDGVSTLEELIWAHPRFRMQARTFLARHAADRARVLAAGERFALALAGNHCQGTLFRDGSRLLTPELEAAFDRIAQRFEGFYIGRFDVRYASEEEFRAGRGFAIVELNGVTAESTNLYDPSWPIWRAYRTLFRQWELLFRVGAANRARGHKATSAREVLALLWADSGASGPSPLAD